MSRSVWLVLLLLGCPSLPCAAAQAPAAKPPGPNIAKPPLPSGALIRLGAARFRMASDAHSVAFSPDGKVLAATDSDGIVRLTNVATGKIVLELPKGTGRLVRFTPDGKHLACGGSEAGLILVDAVSGKQVRVFAARASGQRVWAGHDYVAHGIALSPDGRLLAEGVDKEVVVWDVATGKEVRRYKGHPGWSYSVAFSPDGKILALGDGMGHVGPGQGKGDTHVLLWEVATGKERLRIRTGHFWIYALAFAPDGKTLATVSPHGSSLWDAATGRQRADLDAPGWCLAYSPDGALLALAGRSRKSTLATIHVWETASGKVRHKMYGHFHDAYAVAFAPDSRMLASAGRGGTLHVWDTLVGKEWGAPDSHSASVRAVAFSPDGTRAATVSGGEHTLRIWDTTHGVQLLVIDIPCRFRSSFCQTGHGDGLAFTPDGKTLLCDDHAFDAATGKMLTPLPGKFLAQSPDGKLLAGPTGERFGGVAELKVWERATGRVAAQFAPLGKEPRFDAQATAAAFAPDGRTVAVAAVERYFEPRKAKPEFVFLYDLAAKKLLRKFGADHDVPSRLLFSPDGDLMAAVGGDQVVTVYRVTDWRVYLQLPAEGGWGNRQETRPVAFSPDGRLLAVGGMNDFGISLVELASGKEVHRLLGHKATVNALAFAPDGRRLLAAGEEANGLIWDLAPPEVKWAPLPARNLDLLWKQLAGGDAAAAYRAAWWRLAAHPDKALGLFKERLKPLPEPDPQLVPKLIADLGGKQFNVREAATNQLKKLGSRIDPDLRTALAANPSLEVRRRLERLLAETARQPFPPEELRQLRAVQILGWIGAPAAGQLEVLARGNPAMRPNGAAEAMLRRLTPVRAVAVKAVPPTRPALAAPPRKLPGPRAEVTGLAFSPDGQWLAVTTAEGTLRLHDAATGKMLPHFQGDAAYAVAFSPDGKVLAAGGRGQVVRLWEAATGKPLGAWKGHTRAVTSVAFSPDGKVLASGSLDKTARLWDVGTGKVLHTLAGHEGWVTSVAFARDAKTLATGEVVECVNHAGNRPISTYCSDAVRLRDVATGKGLPKLPEGGHRVTFAPDSRHLAFAELGTAAILGDHSVLLGKGARQNTHGAATNVAYLGSEILVLWDVTAGESRLRLKDVGTALAFSPDGRFLATGRGRDLHHGGHLLQAPDVMRRDGRLRLWETATGKEVFAFPAEAQPTVLAFAPGGRTLAAGTLDGAVHLWDLQPRGEGGKNLAALWPALAGEDAAAAYRAVWALKAAGPKALPFLRERLQPGAADDPRLQQLIKDLGADTFAAREAAKAELAWRGADAAPALRAALQRALTAAVRQRVLALWENPGVTEYPEPQARTRAVGVLEFVRTPEARQLLELLSHGAPLSRQTREARDALGRLALPKEKLP